MRWWRGVLATLVAGFAMSVGALSTTAVACACGAFLLPEEESAEVTDEQAIISWDGAQEQILLTMDVDSTTNTAALLIPTPARAAVSVSDPGAFTELAEFTAPNVERVDLWWPEWMSRVDPSKVGAPANPPVPPSIDLREVEVEVIDSADADELHQWLLRNDLVLRDNVASALMPYIQQGWHFTLINLDTESLQGRLQPIQITFDTNQVVYPMRLSVAGGPLHVSTYVFSDHRMERTDSMGGYLRWAGPVNPTQFTSQTLVDLAGAYPFLTAWEQSFTDPRTQIDGDMVFAAASSDAPFQETYVEVVHHEIFGAPAGPTLVFGGLILLGLLGGAYSVLSRRRQTRV